MSTFLQETNSPSNQEGAALSPGTISIVKSTAPLLAENGEVLTRYFYERMFRGNPEVAPLFNPANQHAGTQQRALAGAICAYAAHIDNLEALSGAVELIAQKHASLQIQAEHYPIVGKHLLGSIREVLGDAATDEVIEAWAEAYQFLAGILIGREREIYHQHEALNKGWSGFRPFRVVKKEEESEVITSFYLEPAGESLSCSCSSGQGGAGGISFKPGQYLTVRLPHLKTGTTMRNYSISSVPWDSFLRISVKREALGYVSAFLHDEMKGGELLEVGPPCGEFFYTPMASLHGEATGKKRPLVLLSAGVGITPLLSILRSALVTEPGRPIYFVHGALNGKTHAFYDAIAKLEANHSHLHVHYRYSEATEVDRVAGRHHSEGFIDLALLQSLLPGADGDFYFCGPKPFMKGVYQDLLRWGIPGNQVHFEFFGPREELEG